MFFRTESGYDILHNKKNEVSYMRVKTGMASRLKIGIIMATHNKNVTQLTNQVQALRKQREQLLQYSKSFPFIIYNL